MKKAAKLVAESFPLLIFILFVNMLFIREAFLVLAMTFFIIICGTTLLFIPFKKIIMIILFKLAYVSSTYFLLSNIVFFDIKTRVIYVLFSLIVIFFGAKLYDFLLRENIYVVSIASLISSVICFFLIKKINSESGLFSLFIIVVILINILIVYFHSNINEISGISKTRHKIPEKLVKNNRILVIATILIASATSVIKEIVSAFEFAIKMIWKGIKEGIIFLLSLIPEKQTENIIGDNGTPTQPFQPLPSFESTPSIFLIILEYIFYAIAIAVVLLILYIISKNLIKLFRKLVNYLMKNQERSKKKNKSEYIDIVETQNILNVAGSKITERFKRIIENRNEKNKIKTKREEIRYMFKKKIRKLIKNGYTFDSSKTANEIYEEQQERIKNRILEEDFIKLYNIARYSEEDIENIKWSIEK